MSRLDRRCRKASMGSLESSGRHLGGIFWTCLLLLLLYMGDSAVLRGLVLHVGSLLLAVGSFCCTRVLVLFSWSCAVLVCHRRLRRLRGRAPPARGGGRGGMFINWRWGLLVLFCSNIIVKQLIEIYADVSKQGLNLSYRALVRCA